MKWDAAAERRAGLPEVSQTGASPHLVGCLPQMVGLGGSRAEDVALILPCLGRELRHGSLRGAGALQERQREISTAAFRRAMPQCFAWIAGVFCDAPLSGCQRLFISAPENF